MLLGLSAPMLLGGICDPQDPIYDAQLCADTGAGQCATGCTVTEEGNIVPSSSSQGQAAIAQGATSSTDWAALALAALQAYTRYSGGVAPPPGWHPPYLSGQPWYSTTGGMLAIGAGVLGVLYLALR